MVLSLLATLTFAGWEGMIAPLSFMHYERSTMNRVRRAAPASRLRPCCRCHAPAKLRRSGQCLPVRSSRVYVIFRFLFSTVRVVGAAAGLFFDFASHADFGNHSLLADLPLFSVQFRLEGSGATRLLRAYDRRGQPAPLIYDVFGRQGTIRFRNSTPSLPKWRAVLKAFDPETWLALFSNWVARSRGGNNIK